MNLSAFLNPMKEENRKAVISQRFVENGKPVEWEIKAISAEQDESIRKTATKKTKNKNGMVEKEIDFPLYLSKLATASVVFPDLQNIELQNAYNVMSGEDLIKKMLTSGEYYRLLDVVKEVNGFEESAEELLDEVKN